MDKWLECREISRFVNTGIKGEMIVNELVIVIVTCSTLDFPCYQGLRLLVSI